MLKLRNFTIKKYLNNLTREELEAEIMNLATIKERFCDTRL